MRLIYNYFSLRNGEMSKDRLDEQKGEKLGDEEMNDLQR